MLQYVTKVFGHLHQFETLFAGGASAYRRRWDAVFSHLGVPSSQRTRGATPATLRGSGATHMYLSCEDLPRVQWRGRWSQLKTVEHYVQEVAAQTLVARLNPIAKRTIQIFDATSTALLAMFLDDDGWLRQRGV